MNRNQTPPELSVDTLLEKASTSDDSIERMVSKLLRQDLFRRTTNNIITEYTDTVQFMEKVQKYADKQIDTRIFKSVKVVVGMIVGWVASIVIAVIIAILLGKN